MRTALKTSDSNLGSYLYQEYSDDEDLQAFVAAQNEAAQTWLDRFNTIALPDYTQLSGDLLNWVVEGLYGLKRTQLASPLSPASGMLNTEVLNTAVLNAYVPSTQTFYDINDDVFKRILTWDFYKGDGKRFTTSWLKRRIIRFIVGTDGVDPQPVTVNDDGTTVLNPTFTVGVETTFAVGVIIVNGVVTVSIDQSTISLQTQLAPNILQLFKLAFEGGALDLPVEYTYAVNIIVNFVAVARPAAVSSTGPAATQTTPATTVVVLGGTGIYTYLWAWQQSGLAGSGAARSTATGSLTAGTNALSGVAAAASSATADLSGASAGAITIDAPTSVSTTFTAAGLAYGETRSGIAVCTVTDTVSGRTATATCAVSITRTGAAFMLSETGDPILLEDGVTPIILES